MVAPKKTCPVLTPPLRPWLHLELGSWQVRLVTGQDGPHLGFLSALPPKTGPVREAPRGHGANRGIMRPHQGPQGQLATPAAGPLAGHAPATPGLRRRPPPRESSSEALRHPVGGSLLVSLLIQESHRCRLWCCEREGQEDFL